MRASRALLVGAALTLGLLPAASTAGAAPGAVVTVEPPGAGSTVLFWGGINEAGTIVGSSFVWNPDGSGMPEFFRYRHGTYEVVTGWTAFDVNNAGDVLLFGNAVSRQNGAWLFPDLGGGEAQVINDRGDLAGGMVSGDGTVTAGFVHRRAGGGRTTTFALPAAASGLTVTDMNDDDELVGFYDVSAADGSFGRRGFVYAHGTVTELAVPGSTLVMPQGINADGVVVGWYVDAVRGLQSFRYADGAVQPVTVLGGAANMVGAIADDGTIAGVMFDGSNRVFVQRAGTTALFVLPGYGDSVNGINGDGVVIGTYYGADGATHGFRVATR